MTLQRSAIVVEDDGAIRELLREVLVASGFDVHLAQTGGEGLQLAEQVRPDLVTLDVGLPGVGGMEVCRQIREISDAYIVMITGRTDEADRLLGLSNGADDYVIKPFSPRELQARVAAMFRRPRHAPDPVPVVPPQPVARMPLAQPLPVPAGYAAVPAAEAYPAPTLLRHGAIELDLESRAVRRDGTPLSLTRIEFELLARLIRNPRRVWPRDVLLKEVWGVELASDYHVVDVHIGNLRRKLGPWSGGGGVIRTVRGVGFGLAPLPGDDG